MDINKVAKACARTYACGLLLSMSRGFIFGSYSVANEHIKNKRMKDTIYNRLRYGLIGTDVFGVMWIYAPISFVSPSVQERIEVFAEMKLAPDTIDE